MARWQDGRAQLRIIASAADPAPPGGPGPADAPGARETQAPPDAADADAARAVGAWRFPIRPPFKRRAGGKTAHHRGGAPQPAAAIPLEIAASFRARTRGLLGRDGIDGAILLTPAGSVHTLNMRFSIDVAYLDRDLRVIAVRAMKPGRLGLPRPRSRHVLEAEAGAMGRWGLRPGSRVAIERVTAAGRRTP